MSYSISRNVSATMLFMSLTLFSCFFISSKTLDGDFDEEQMCYKDHFGQKKYRLGMPLKVKLVRTDKTYRTIDFEVEKVKVIKNKNV